MHRVLEALSEPGKDWRSCLQHQVEKPCEQMGPVQCLPPVVNERQVAGVSLQSYMEMTVFLGPTAPSPHLDICQLCFGNLVLQQPRTLSEF